MRIFSGAVDVLVIGAGMAGLALAGELARRARCSVAVLEAGPDHGHDHIRAIHPSGEALRLWLSPETDPDFCRPYQTEGEVYRGLAGLRRRVGGRSLYWGGVLLPVEPWALAEGWPTTVVDELATAWDDGPGLYQRVSDDVLRWNSEPLAGPGLDIAGIELHHTPQAVRPEPSGRWSAFSPLSWWDEQEGDPKVRQVPILAEHSVTAVLTEHGQAVGARVRTATGETKDFRAAKVVLATGTIENSRMAIQALADVGAGNPRRELPGLVDKIAQGFVCTMPDDDRLPPAVRAAAWSGRAYHRIGDADSRFNHFVRFTSTSAGSITMDSWAMGEQQRTQHGRITSPPTTIHADLGSDDEKQRLAQQDFLRDFWSAAAAHLNAPATPLEFAADHGSPDLPARLTSDSPTPVTYSFPLGSEQHEAGTIALGELLTEDHQFRDVPGLYACGPCTFPRTGAANPTMTTLALAKRLGGILSA